VCLLPSEKLVRDKIPSIILKHGNNPRVRRANPEEIDYLLRQKAVEEAQELLASGSLEELADLLEVILALLKHRGVSWETLEEIRLRKQTARGGFDEGFVLQMEP